MKQSRAREFCNWNPRDPFAWQSLGDSCFELNRDSEGMRAFSLYLKTNSGFQLLFQRYVYLLDRNKKWIEAREISQKYESDKTRYLSEELIFKKIEQGDVSAITEYLEKGGDPNLVDQKMSSQSLLIKAVFFGKTEIALKILEYNPLLNAVDSNNCTALMYAAENGRNFLFETLLNRGADAWIKTKWGETAGDLALGKRNYDAIVFLLKKYPVAQYKEHYRSILFYAAGWGFPEFVKILLDEGVPFQEVVLIPKNPKRKTALMNACEWAHLEVIRLLMDRSANLNNIDNNGKTALHYLADSKPFPNLEFYQWMISKGAKEDTKDLSGKTALDLKLNSPAKLRLLDYHNP